MKIIHTSDWHLGALLHEQSRIPEQAAFLGWLKSLMVTEKPDALIIAGDIFDTCTPSNTALNLYYDFLAASFKENLCNAVVVAGGNHDSPSLLDAPGNVLAHLHTRVIGTVDYLKNDNGGYLPNYEKEIVVVNDADGKPGLVIGAVPYLRDADLRTSEALETDVDRSEKLRRGFKEHYRIVAELARQRAAFPSGSQLPVVLTGHLFLTGATTAEEKSERDLQVGNLGSLEMALLPQADYYALGHLHGPQTVGGMETCRYSGAPIPMSFGEAKQTKSVAIVEFSVGAMPVVRLETVPQTQKLAQLKGTPETIAEHLKELVACRESVWTDIQVNDGIGDLTPWWSAFSSIAEGSSVRLLRWQNARPGKNGSALAGAIIDDAQLEHLTPAQLFDMRLNDEDLTAAEKVEFSAMFAEVLQNFIEADTNKE
jgi:exonuclease SbcD